MGLLWHEIGQKETPFRFDFQIFSLFKGSRLLKSADVKNADCHGSENAD